jgi:hypothetical protein
MTHAFKCTRKIIKVCYSVEDPDPIGSGNFCLSGTGSEFGMECSVLTGTV